MGKVYCNNRVLDFFQGGTKQELSRQTKEQQATNQQARCYCIFALEKTIELYPDPKESDKNISTDTESLKKIRNAGLNGLKNVKDLNTCM